MKTRTLKTTALRGDAGFTAIEIAMVAAVIAILSLIVLPVFRNRVEEAKVAAAQADLSALMKSEQLVKADIDAYARLEDLDNVELFGYQGAAPVGGINKEVPAFKYQTPVSTAVGPDPLSRNYLDATERAQLAGQPSLPIWKGPYIAFQRALLYKDLVANPTLAPMILRSSTGNTFAAIQDGNPTFPDHQESRIPVDPWGNPYLFFPPTGNAADASAAAGSSASAVIYSLGPNGLPGDGSAPGNAATYTREYAINNAGNPEALGSAQGDDLMVEF